jgi:hypothetical protein
MSVESDWTTHLFEWMKAQETINIEMSELAKRIDGIDVGMNKMVELMDEQAKRIKEIEAVDEESTRFIRAYEDIFRRIEALETRLAMPADPLGKFAESYIDSVDYRKDDYQPKRDVTVRRNARPVSQPELIDGWWYKSPVCKIVDNGESSAYVRYTGIKADGSSFPIIGSTISSFSLATLDDLAHEVDGVKVWMVEESNSIVMYVGTSDSFMVRFYNRNSRDEQPIARYIATKCGWPIIPDAQMRSLRNESDRYNHRNV